MKFHFNEREMISVVYDDFSPCKPFLPAIRLFHFLLRKFNLSKNEYDDIIFAVVRREIVGNNDGWLNANVNTYQTSY